MCVYKDEYALIYERLVSKKDMFLVTSGKKGIISKKKRHVIRLSDKKGNNIKIYSLRLEKNVILSSREITYF